MGERPSFSDRLMRGMQHAQEGDVGIVLFEWSELRQDVVIEVPTAQGKSE